MRSRTERKRMRNLWRLRSAAVLVIASAALAGCGGSSSSSSSGSGSGTNSTGAGGKAVRGGNATILWTAGGIDSLDPGYWYYQDDYEDIQQPTQMTLYTFTDQGTVPVPELATGMPTLSNGDKTMTIHIKPGVHYSAPLASKTVTSADIKYAMTRCFLASVGNGYAQAYYSKIVGAPSTPATKTPNITGLQTPNPTTLVINTSVPVGVLTDANALVLPCTVPVPQSYAAKYDGGSTSTYGMHQVFTGPYMIQGAGSGTVPSSAYSPGRILTLVRNPSWSKANDPYAGAYFNQIQFKGEYDITVASRDTLSGTSILSGDYAAPPTSILQQGLTSSQKSQFHILPSGGNRYISLNTTIPPLNNINVRKAINAVINKNALRLTRGGPTLGTIATHYIPPGLPGYAQAGGATGPGYDFDANPNGNLTLAEKYMKMAGYSTGKYTGAAILTIADNEPPASNTALAVQSQLATLGFKLNFREVPHATVLSKFCLVPKAKVAICPTLGWGKDFDDAQSMIDPVFNGKNIVPVGNTNSSQTNNPTLNAAMDKAEEITDVNQRASAWGKIDQQVTAQAASVPWLWDNEVTFASKNVHGVNWNFNGNAWDLTNSYLTNG
jgi:peptide/nickel transport system substrate-binding protein